jgi:hypothetical protein
MSSSRSFKSLTAMLTLSALLIAVPVLLAQEKQVDAAMSKIVSGNGQFAIALYQNINADQASNRLLKNKVAVLRTYE